MDVMLAEAVAQRIDPEDLQLARGFQLAFFGNKK